MVARRLLHREIQSIEEQIAQIKLDKEQEIAEFEKKQENREQEVQIKLEHCPELAEAARPASSRGAE